MLKTVSYLSSAFMLRILLFFGITFVSLALIVTNKTHVKNIVSDSGVYRDFVPAVIEETAKKSGSTIPLSRPDIKAAIESGFDANVMQDNAENFIDGTYAWLNGTSSDYTFKIDLTVARQQTADSISKLAFDRIRTLPVCFAAPETFDPFTVGCQPPSTDLGAEQAKLSALIAGETGILPKAVFTQNDLPKNGEGKQIQERYNFAHALYQWLKFSPLIIGFLILVFSFPIVLLSRTRREGFRRLGSIIFGSGVTLLITPILLMYILPGISDSMKFSSATNNNTSAVVSNLINYMTESFYSLLFNIALQVITIGAIILMAEYVSRPKSKYSAILMQTGLISSHTRKPSSGKKFKPFNVPVQSSEESVRRKPRKTRNRKYRKIILKEK
ncbi:MAG: hypothetical protein U0451_02415 [Candidatus Saccharimonadales bacterium]